VTARAALLHSFCGKHCAQAAQHSASDWFEIKNWNRSKIWQWI